jgi:flagellar protein FliO/FliZ
LPGDSHRFICGQRYFSGEYTVGFLTSLFGGETNFVTMAIALAIVLVLIVLAVWLIKAIGDATRNVGRGRNRRLMVIDSVAIDQKRQAIIIRRDGIEHLILTGGPNDLVVESGFEAPAQQAVQRPARRVAPTDPAKPQASVPEVDAEAPSRLNGANSGSGKSLRHTALLRPVDDREPKLDGGNRDKHGAKPTDSVKPVSLVAQPEPAEPKIESRDDNYAQEGKSRQ